MEKDKMFWAILLALACFGNYAGLRNYGIATIGGAPNWLKFVWLGVGVISLLVALKLVKDGALEYGYLD